MMKFNIGTTNKYKVREIGAILSASGCEFEVTDPVDPEETEDDFVGNAILKAKIYAKHCKGLTISEDSGLIIPAINGLPGPWSARFSDCRVDKKNHKIISHTDSGLGRDVIDRQNCKLVLEMMKNVQTPFRVACFQIVLVVADKNGNILFQEAAESNGSIAFEMGGNNGFGYDSIFIGNDTFGKTYAELDSQRKNLRSHRRLVLNRFKTWLGRYVIENMESAL